MQDCGFEFEWKIDKIEKKIWNRIVFKKFEQKKNMNRKNSNRKKIRIDI